jgi:hypothetical protein
MAKRNSTLKARPGRNRTRRDPESDLEPLFNPLEKAIEKERSRLGRAETVLKCLHLALLYSDAHEIEGPELTDAATVAKDLVQEAIDGLDSASLGPLVERVVRTEARKLASGRKS